MEFVGKVKAQSARRHPVRNTVEEHWSDIQAARAAGCSLNAIFRQLKAEGKSVGKGYSSFRNAVKYLDQHPPVRSAEQRQERRQPAITSTNKQRDQFLDERFPSDF